MHNIHSRSDLRNVNTDFWKSFTCSHTEDVCAYNQISTYTTTPLCMFMMVLQNNHLKVPMTVFCEEGKCYLHESTSCLCMQCKPRVHFAMTYRPNHWNHGSKCYKLQLFLLLVFIRENVQYYHVYLNLVQSVLLPFLQLGYTFPAR